MPAGLQFVLATVLSAVWVIGVAGEQRRDHDLSAVVQSAGVDPRESGLLIVRLNDGTRWQSGGRRIDAAFPPASTSKIPHTLIALETGFASGADASFAWDGVRRFADAWNRDQTLLSAYRESAVWVYQHITRSLGHETMSSWIDRFGYGNRDIGTPDDLTSYWLRGPLQTTAREQVEFLTRLVRRELPLEPQSFEVGRRIMQADEGEGWKLYAKTGWYVRDDGKDIGWYVGWVELAQSDLAQVYVFAFNLDMVDVTDRMHRRTVVRAALIDLGVID